jgi:serine/threonine protein kinase
LLKVAVDEPVDAAVSEHVGGCAKCRAAVARFRGEIASLVKSSPDGKGSRSTERDPDLGGEAQPPNASSTVSWKSDAGAQATDAQPSAPDDIAAARERALGPDSLPDAIGRYKVVGRIDTGGEADVYRVVHIELGNDLVLKLARRRARTEDRSGLASEGRLLVDLKHPNLVRIYDLDFHDERPYLVMEYVHGRNLEDYARDEPVSPRRAAELVAKLAAVMSVAHGHGITHCDIKPKNVLMDKLGEPRLIDFGMARLRHAWSDIRHSSWGGTLAYMAPEQARLEIDRIGPRSDIFALGGVLYFLLTGQAPFTGETSDEIWDRAKRCDFEAGALQTAKVPRSLARICLKAMAADPADRCATAEALQRALARFVNLPKIVGLSACALGLVLLLGLVYTLMSSRSDATPSQSQNVVIHRPPPAAGALTGDLTVRVRSKPTNVERELKVGDPRGLPLLAGELVHLEANLNQPAYVYLLWLDGRGKVSLLFPRADGKFGSRPSDGKARETVHSPEALDDWLPMEGPGGLETVLLLARRTPLPPGTDLAAMIGPQRASPPGSELALSTRGLNEGQPIELLVADQVRGIGENAEKLDDPLLKLMERLRAEGHFDVIKSARFPYRGE